MADQRAITLYAGDAAPTTIVLRDLPAADVAALPVMWLYPISAPEVPQVPDPRVITLYDKTGTTTEIVARAIPVASVVAPSVVITLHSTLAAEGYTPPEPPTFFGVLKRWTGAAWVKAKLLAYVGGSWVAKPLKRWTGSAWVAVDATGV